MEKLGMKEALLQRVKNDIEASEKGSARHKVLSAMLVPAMAMAAPGVASANAADTGQDLLDKIQDFATSPFMIAICIIAVILGVLFAIGGNIKAAFVPFGLAAIVAVGPWLVNEIFEVMKL